MESPLHWKPKLLIFATYASIALWQPFLPLVAGGKGLNALQIGFLQTTISTFSLGAVLVSGAAADRWRCHANLVTLLTSAAAASMMGFAWATRFEGMLLAAGVYGMAQGPTKSLVDALVLAELGSDRQLYSRQRLWGSVAYGMTTTLVGALAPSDEGSSRLRNLPVATAVALISIGGIAMLFRERSAEPTFAAWGDLLQYLRRRPVQLCLLNIFLIGLWEQCTNIFLFPYLQTALRTPTFVLGVSKAVAVCSEVISFSLLPYFLDRFGAGPVICVGAAGFTVKLASYAVLRHPWGVVAVEALHGLCYSPVIAGAVHHLTSETSGDLSGMPMAALSLAYYQLTGIVGGALTGTVTASEHGYRDMLFISCVGCALSLLLTLRLIHAGVYRP
eukprot:Sspe_Gene.95180::Locus_67490_Transcript_1_1_Confidence_1.000_Length_1234::g.95180::m.95180